MSFFQKSQSRKNENDLQLTSVPEDVRAMVQTTKDIVTKLGRGLAAAWDQGVDFVHRNKHSGNVFSDWKNQLLEFVHQVRQDVTKNSPIDDDDAFASHVEDLFRSISEKEAAPSDVCSEDSKMIVYPEAMRGIRVVGVPGPVIDAEILSKRFERR
jgi:hypothetical protein